MKQRKEYARGGAGPEHVRTVIEESIGKTIASIAFGPCPAVDSLCHQDEYLVFHFTDGSELELQGGSNSGNLDGHYRDDTGKRLRASDISLSFVAMFRENRETA